MTDPQWSSYRALVREDRQRVRWALRNGDVLGSSELNSAALAWGRRQVSLALVLAAAFFVVGIIAIYLTDSVGFAFLIPTFGMVVSAAMSRRQVRRLTSLIQSREDDSQGR